MFNYRLSPTRLSILLLLSICNVSGDIFGSEQNDRDIFARMREWFARPGANSVYDTSDSAFGSGGASAGLSGGHGATSSIGGYGSGGRMGQQQPASSGGPSTIVVQGGSSGMSEDALLALEKEKTRQLELANAQKLQEEHERNKWFNALTQYHDQRDEEREQKNNEGFFRQVKNMLSWHHQTLREIEQERAQAELDKEKVRLKGLPQTLEHDLRKTRMLHDQSLEKMKLFGRGVMRFTDDKERMTQVALATGGAALGIYAAKRGTKVAADYASSVLMKPSLVTETSRLTLSQIIMNPIATYQCYSEQLPRATYNSALQSQVDTYVSSIIEGRKDGQPFRHALFYGAPGTGKTLLAKKIAKELGMNYAIIPGANIHQFNGEEGVKEINKLFDWAEKSRTVLFFDECDALVPSRLNSSVSEQSRKIQNTIYARTGTETDKFLIIGATNEPGMLDTAFLSRMDERIEFELPDHQTRAELVKLYFKKYIAADKVSDDGEEHFVWVAKMTDGFSGRELSQLVRSFSAQAATTEDKKITGAVVQKVVHQKIGQRAKLINYSSKTVAKEELV